MYPGNSGYYSHVGGDLKNLRNSTTIEKVRQYHQKFYRPDNLILTITGRIDESQLFAKVRSIEEKFIKSPNSNCSFKRPWQNSLEPIGSEFDVSFTHEFPSDDESKGHVLIGWRLNKHITEDIQLLDAFKLMLMYLTSSRISPFRQNLLNLQSLYHQMLLMISGISANLHF